jgi:hypothetical protein
MVTLTATHHSGEEIHPIGAETMIYRVGKN